MGSISDITRFVGISGLIGLITLVGPLGAQETVRPPRRLPPPPAAANEGRVPLGSLSDAQLKQVVIKMLRDAAAGQDPLLRSHAIESLKHQGPLAVEVAQRGLRDANPGVRFAAVVVVGIKRFQNLAPFVRPLLNDGNPSVRAAAHYALRNLGERVDLTPLARMLEGDDAGLRSNVAVVLGLLGDRSAIPMLQQAARAPMPRASAAESAAVRVQYAEALARLGDTKALDSLRAGMYSQFGDVRVLSITALGAVGDRRMEGALVNLLKDPGITPPPGATPEFAAQARLTGKVIQLASAGALARVGNRAGQAVVQRLAVDANDVIRKQSAWVLGWFSDPASLAVLRRMLVDADPVVRITAADAILRRMTPGSNRS